MGANHVAARVAFDHGVHATTAVAVRSIVTALAVGALVVVPARSGRAGRAAAALPAGDRGSSLPCRARALIPAVARLPVALAPSSPSTPIRSGPRSGRACCTRTGPSGALPSAMALCWSAWRSRSTSSGAASGVGAALQWQRIGAGVAFALAAAASFGLALVLTQHEAGTLDGRLRTTSTMAIVAVLALGGLPPRLLVHPPNAPGWLARARAQRLLIGPGIPRTPSPRGRRLVVSAGGQPHVALVSRSCSRGRTLGQAIAPSQVAGRAARGGDRDVARPAAAGGCSAEVAPAFPRDRRHAREFVVACSAPPGAATRPLPYNPRQSSSDLPITIRSSPNALGGQCIVRATDTIEVGDLPLRAELFSAQQIASHGERLARRHVVSDAPLRDRLLARLADNERLPRRRLPALALTAATHDRAITPAGRGGCSTTST